MDLTTSPIVRSFKPPRRRGFPADLSLGFYLFAPERMTYVWAGRTDRYDWRTHRFVAFDGRLVKIDLPPTVKLFVWPAGNGPRPQDSVATRSSIWGRVPPHSLHGIGSVSLARLYRLWRQFSRPRSSSALQSERTLSPVERDR